MADTKISELTSGGQALSTDETVIVRAGENYKVALGNLNTLVVGNLVVSTGLTFNGNLSVGNIAATTGTFTNVAGTLTTAAQTNITSIGTLSALAVTGNVSAGNVSGTSLSGTLETAAQPNVTSVGTLSALTVTGNVSAGNVSGTDVSGTTGTFTTVSGTLTTAAQTNITSLGNLTSLTLAGNVSGTEGVFTGNITAANFIGNVSVSATANEVVIGSGSGITSSSDFTWDSANGTLWINTADGSNVSVEANTALASANIAIFGATGNVTGGGTGASVTIKAGQGTGGSSSAGGHLILAAGDVITADQGIGGSVTINAGEGWFGNGGNITLTSGSGNAGPGPAKGGNIAIITGAGSGTGDQGGDFTVTTGNGSGSSHGGDITFTTGVIGTGSGGDFTVTLGAGGHFVASATNSYVQLSATGSGSSGVYLGSGNNIDETRTDDLVWIPVANGAPNSSPSGSVANLVAMVYDQVNNTISVYSGGSWRSVTLT